MRPVEDSSGSAGVTRILPCGLFEVGVSSGCLSHCDYQSLTRRLLTTTWAAGLRFEVFPATSPPQSERDRIGHALFEFYVVRSSGTPPTTVIRTPASTSSRPTTDEAKVPDNSPRANFVFMGTRTRRRP
jgi:hypothetical protein